LFYHVLIRNYKKLLIIILFILPYNYNYLLKCVFFNSYYLVNDNNMFNYTIVELKMVSE
jgi:hypothetical protein